MNYKKMMHLAFICLEFGFFYNILNEDAKIINEKLGLKITDLGSNIFKCDFPVSQLDKYIILLNKIKIKYKIIDNLPNNSNQQAFNTLLDIQNKLKNIK